MVSRTTDAPRDLARVSLPRGSRGDTRGVYRWSMSAPAAESPSTYDHALYGAGRRWRGVVAILVFVAGYLLLSLALSGIAIGVDLATGDQLVDDVTAGRVALTPVVILANNLSLAALIPLALLLQRAFFGVPMRTLFSVTGRFRWRWTARLALIIVPVWAVYIGASFLLDPLQPVVIDGTTLFMLAVVVLTTPLQSAGEEFGFRGLVQRSAGSWFHSPRTAFVVSTIVSAGIFTVAHLAADPWLIAYYFVFGVSASLAARATGGLEAPVLVHVVNNVLLLVPVVLMGQMESSFDRGVGAGGPFMLLPMAVCLLAAAISAWWGRRNGVVTRSARPGPARPGPVRNSGRIADAAARGPETRDSRGEDPHSA
jgi:membrane protease YdiL (CAAX protease family)